MKPKPPQTTTSAPGTLSPKKRQSPVSSIPSPTSQRPTFTAPSSPRRRGSAGGQISRSISACNRCRSRKTKCDQLFPSCSSCAKAGVECVGIDAATGREVPRSYVDWLEKRVTYLEQELGIAACEGGATEGEGNLAGSTASKRKLSCGTSEGGDEGRRCESNVEGVLVRSGSSRNSVDGLSSTSRDEFKTEEKALHLRPDIENLVSQVGLVSVQGTSAPGFLGGSSGISFARLMFTAVNKPNRDGAHLSSQPSIKPAPSPRSTTGGTDTVVESSIQLSRQRFNPEPFPPRHLGVKYLDIYFNMANAQHPVLHQPSFRRVFDCACTRIEQMGGAGLPDPSLGGDKDHQHHADLYFLFMVFAIASAMSAGSGSLPERYHATAMLHMDSLFAMISLTNNRLGGLKGILLLAQYSIMRAAAPGVWYVLGAALRLAVDLGLHDENTSKVEKTWDPLIIDERRRLWWCTYALDRQLGIYLGRPFGIADDAIKTPLPVREIVGWSYPEEDESASLGGRRTCRIIFLHMFRIRQIQSEIQRVLYQSISSLPREFVAVEDWRKDVEDRLQTWCRTVPKSKDDTRCGFNLDFMELNYQQTRLLLYGLCPSVPRPSVEDFEAIADSGSRIIRLYRRLHHEGCINYTWLSCHNLFMAGTSYLCALWHCPEVRRRTTVEQIDFDNLACVGVLSSMIDRCPAAQGCKDVFEHLATATVKLCNSELARDRDSHKRVKTEGTGWSPAGSKSPMGFTPVPQSLPASLANIVHAAPYQQLQPNYTEMMPQDLPLFGEDMYPQDLAAECMNMDVHRVFEMMQQVGIPGGSDWDADSWSGGVAGGYGGNEMMGLGMGDSNGNFLVRWTGL